MRDSTECYCSGVIEDDVQRVHECAKVLDPDDVLVMDANTGQSESSVTSARVRAISCYFQVGFLTKRFALRNTASANSTTTSTWSSPARRSKNVYRCVSHCMHPYDDVTCDASAGATTHQPAVHPRREHGQHRGDPDGVQAQRV